MFCRVACENSGTGWIHYPLPLRDPIGIISIRIHCKLPPPDVHDLAYLTLDPVMIHQYPLFSYSWSR